MTAVKIAALAITAVGVYAILAAPAPVKTDNTVANVEKAVHWLVSVQGRDGGWGQDGGETSFVRTGEHLESNGLREKIVHAGGEACFPDVRARIRGQCDDWERFVAEFRPDPTGGFHAVDSSISALAGDHYLRESRFS